MAKVIWTEPALSDLDAIGDYITLQNPVAAASLITRIFEHAAQLQAHPESGSKLVELRRSRYRQIVEPACRAIYRCDDKSVFILHVLRSKRLLPPVRLRRKSK